MSMMKTKVFSFTEHEAIEKDKCPEIFDLEKEESLKLMGYPEEFMGTPKYLGILSTEKNYEAAYYIGATWIKENEIAAIVKPKIEDIDYMKMFSDALDIDSKNESDYFSKCYGIEYDKPEIEVDSSLNFITPLILLHYVSVLKNLTKHGLKKGYVYKKENLQSKVKGHILFQSHIRKNVINKREDKVFCGFQEYTEDIPENRLLKKALLFANAALNNYGSYSKPMDVENSINNMLKIFSNVSDEIEISEVRFMGNNKLFAGYKKAITLAKNVLRHFDYSIQNTEKQNTTTVPFWIDMPRLYELYVYKYLDDSFPGDVMFQVQGYQSTAADYILKSKNMVLDAKYKPRYNDSNSGIIPDIEEISRYARDEKILSNMQNPDGKIKCVILYPSNNSVCDKIEDSLEDENEFLLTKQKIKPYKDFYKFKIDVPKLE